MAIFDRIKKRSLDSANAKVANSANDVSNYSGISNSNPQELQKYDVRSHPLADGLPTQEEMERELEEVPSPDTPPSPDQASGQPMTPEAGEDGLKTQNPGQSDPQIVRWKSPLFGELEAPILSRGTHFFSLEHPLTGEVVRIPNEWLVSLDERSAILEYDGGLPREEADRRARIEFFGLFREGGGK